MLCRALHLEPVEVLERVDLALAVPVDLTGLTQGQLRDRAREAFLAGNYRAALAVYDAMTQLLLLDPPDDPENRRRTAARIEINKAVTLRRCSALRTAQHTAQRAVELAEGLPGLQSEGYMVLASLLSHEGFVVLAVDMAGRAVDFATEASDDRLLAQAWNQKGSVLHRAREFEPARQAFLEARKFAVKARDHRHQIKVEGNIGSCLHDLGRSREARRRYSRALELARKHGDRAAEAFWLIDLGFLLMDGSDAEEADRCARAALRIAKPLDQLLNIFRAEWLRHLVVRSRRPEASDRHRLAYLRKLFGHVKEHRTERAVREFGEQVLKPDWQTDRRLP